MNWRIYATVFASKSAMQLRHLHPVRWLPAPARYPIAGACRLLWHQAALRRIDRWHPFGRVRYEVRVSSRNGRERNNSNNQN